MTLLPSPTQVCDSMRRLEIVHRTRYKEGDCAWSRSNHKKLAWPFPVRGTMAIDSLAVGALQRRQDPLAHVDNE
jgi:hypothetical protein